jgi:GNAT superfamily N-acetyltransferase
MQFRKVQSSDEQTIIDFFNELDDTVSSHETKRKLFAKQFDCEENFHGILIEDKGKVIAYLGLIFSERTFGNQVYKFCNLTSFLIDPAYRGQKLTHKIIDEVLKLGDYTITAITPIPSLYRMYESKGLKKLDDYRSVFWKFKGYSLSEWKIISSESEIKELLDENNLKIYSDHNQFSCQTLVFSNGIETLLLIGKEISAQKRRFITGRIINYLDLLSRKIINYSFLNKTVVCFELAYCSNYQILLDKFKSVAPEIFKAYTADGIIIRRDVIDLLPLKKYKHSEFWKARQLYFSNHLSPIQYDTLYSEIFVLDLT